MKKLKVVIIGAGSRGIGYADKMTKLPDKYEIVAVAEPNEDRRNYVKTENNIPDDRCFTDWKPLLELGKIADIAVIATMDRDHFEPTMKAIELGYDLLLEKPISADPAECIKVAQAAEAANVKVVICTVLRYTPLFMTLRDMIEEGRIGDVMAVNHEECVGNIHQSHSFVRGKWCNEGRSSNMILQKSCHDMDLLQWLLGKQPKKIQSFGTLSYFTEKNAPEGAPEYCYQGCPAADTCMYNAMKIYFDKEDTEHYVWFRTASTEKVNPTDEDVMKVMKETQYGKCVYKCDNDVVDHQVANILFEDDITVTFTMNAFNKGGRFIHIMGTKGEIRAALDGDTPISLYNFETKETEVIEVGGRDGIANGHGGGDEGIILALYDYVCGTYTGKSVPTIMQAAKNHLMSFAAEKSRLENVIVDFDEYVESLS